MEITFSTTSSVDFKRDIEVEGIGFENDFNSIAIITDNGNTWVTWWSSFEYTVIDSSFRTDGKTILKYTGAKNGFLQQELLPEFKDVLIIEINGSYGFINFGHGVSLKEAFDVYDTLKEDFKRSNADRIDGIYKICRFFCDENGDKIEKHVAEISKLIRSRDCS